MNRLCRIIVSNPFLRNSGGELFGKLQLELNKSHVATIKYFAPPPEEKEIEWPEVRIAKVLPKVPVYPYGIKARKMRKMLALTKGPEHVHNFLMYDQFGFQALEGGRMNSNHFEFFRNSLTRILKFKEAFFIWRIDPPWQAVSKKTTKKKMGGGKAAIHHYVTPVRAGRILIEFGGILNPEEVSHSIAPLAECFPFEARFVTTKIIEDEIKEEEWKEKNNINPYTFKYVIQNNMGGCNNWLSRYDYIWFGKYR